MLRVPEVAERLRVAISTVYALIESGKLQAFRVGPHDGAIRVSEEQFQAYLETCRSLPHSEIPATEAEGTSLNTIGDGAIPAPFLGVRHDGRKTK